MGQPVRHRRDDVSCGARDLAWLCRGDGRPRDWFGHSRFLLERLIPKDYIAPRWFTVR
jgi:hypothetical protein